MANKVTFDYSLTENVISADEIKSMEKITNDAKELLLSKEGAGSDFLGWIDLPIDYDKEEFARIQKAAEKIQSDSEVLLVIGIGGSYQKQHLPQIALRLPHKYSRLHHLFSL